MKGRHLREIAEYERSVEKVLDSISYEDLEDEALLEMYEDICSNYNLVQAWRKDENISWVTVDDFLQSTADTAETLDKAYNG